MAVHVPSDLSVALELLVQDPALAVLAGGTDLMVELNYGHRRPESILSLRRVEELSGWVRQDDELWLGSRLTYREMMEPTLAAIAPGLAAAARTVGSPQIRATGTLGGNLATASPAGDTLPMLVALGAVVELVSLGGQREVAIEDFLIGPRRTALLRGELVRGVRVPIAKGPQEFLKIGTRNAMVIAVASCALVVDRSARTVRCALGSVGPVALRCGDAEASLAGFIDWESGRLGGVSVVERFSQLVADTAKPIDDHRSTARYRRHAVSVLAARALRRAF